MLNVYASAKKSIAVKTKYYTKPTKNFVKPYSYDPKKSVRRFQCKRNRLKKHIHKGTWRRPNGKINKHKNRLVIKKIRKNNIKHKKLHRSK